MPAWFSIGNRERPSYDISDEFTASDSPKIVDIGQGLFGGVIVKTDGSNNASISIYNNGKGDTSGTKLIPANTLIRGTKDIWAVGGLDIAYDKGITVIFSGTGASFQVLYAAR